MPCDEFVDRVLHDAGLNTPRTSTGSFNPTPAGYVKLTDGMHSQPGDVIVQNGHMGIYVGDENGAPMGASMASLAGTSVKAFKPKGYYDAPDDMRFYRALETLDSSVRHVAAS